MRDRYEDIEGAGASVAVIGMGAVQRAARFKKQLDIPFPLLVDRTRETYRLLELRRGNWNEVAGPKVWMRGLRSLAGGNRQTLRPTEDPLQLGGAAVILPGDRLAFLHRSKASSDNVPVDALLEALP